MIDIDVDRVSKRFRRGVGGRGRTLRTWSQWRAEPQRSVLHDVSLTVNRGETMGIIGPNGSGKSTLLRLMAGLSQPTEGAVRTRGRISGLLTLGGGLHPWLTGRENAVTGGILAGLGRTEANRRVDAIATFAGLEDRMEDSLRTYSAGMTLRLAFAAAINIDPEILLIDEILSVGDLRFQKRCVARLNELQAAGVTLVVVSHDLAQVRELCDQAVAIVDGRIRHAGPVEDVTMAYESEMTGVAPDGLSLSDALEGTSSGTGEVEIVAVRLLDARRSSVGAILPGTSLVVEIDYVVHQPVDDAVFSVSLHPLSGGAHCFDLNTETDGTGVGALSDRGTVRLHLDRIDLDGGQYSLAVGVYPTDWRHPYHYVWQVAQLEVAVDGTGSGYEPPHRWSLS